MAKKDKFDEKKLKGIFEKSMGSYDHFLLGAKEKGISKYYVDKYWKIWSAKQTVAPDVQETPLQPKPPENPPPVSEAIGEAPELKGTPVTASDVKIETTPENTESSELQKSYREMFREYGAKPGAPSMSDVPSDAPSEDPTQTTTQEAADSAGASDDIGSMGTSGVEGDNYGMGGNPGFTIKLGQIGYMLARTIDNNIWSERPLSEDEKKDIKRASDDLETAYKPMLDNENAPLINYVTVGFLIPAVTRLDLLPAKLQGLMKMFNKGNNDVPKAPPGQQAAPEAPVEPTTANHPGWKTNPNLSSNQRAMIEEYVRQGKRVADNFDPNLAIDIMAFQNGEVRNVSRPVF